MIFPKPTVDSIMAGFTKAITQLTDLADAKVAENLRISDEVAALEETQDANIVEIHRAEEVRKRLLAIVSPAKELDDEIPF